MYKPEACSRSGEYLFLVPRPRNNMPISTIPTENGPIHVEFSIIHNVMSSIAEAELG